MTIFHRKSQFQRPIPTLIMDKTNNRFQVGDGSTRENYFSQMEEFETFVRIQPMGFKTEYIVYQKLRNGRVQCKGRALGKSRNKSKCSLEVS